MLDFVVFVIGVDFKFEFNFGDGGVIVDYGV